VIAVEPQQPRYLSHGDAAAAQWTRFPERQTLLVGSVIVRNACPARRSTSRTKASRSASAVSTATAGPSSRRSRLARSLRVPPGHLTLSAAPLASPTADSSHLRLPLSTPVLLSTPALHSVLSRSEDSSGHHRRSRAVSRTPSRFQDLMCHTPLRRTRPDVMKAKLNVRLGQCAREGTDYERIGRTILHVGPLEPDDKAGRTSPIRWPAMPT
jgi:hypothetical protein